MGLSMSKYIKQTMPYILLKLTIQVLFMTAVLILLGILASNFNIMVQSLIFDNIDLAANSLTNMIVAVLLLFGVYPIVRHLTNRYITQVVNISHIATTAEIMAEIMQTSTSKTSKTQARAKQAKQILQAEQEPAWRK